MTVVMRGSGSGPAPNADPPPPASQQPDPPLTPTVLTPATTSAPPPPTTTTTATTTLNNNADQDQPLTTPPAPDNDECVDDDMADDDATALLAPNGEPLVSRPVSRGVHPTNLTPATHSSTLSQFPLAELNRLDDMINRPRWVIPVLPKGELETLLDASIRLAKHDLDSKCEACQRFYRDGLMTSFTKILTDEAVSGWKFEIHVSVARLSRNATY